MNLTPAPGGLPARPNVECYECRQERSSEGSLLAIDDLAANLSVPGIGSTKKTDTKRSFAA